MSCWNLLLPVLETTDQQRVPQGVNLRPPCVHHVRQVFVDFSRAQFVIVLSVHFFFDDEVVEDVLQILEVGHVATCSDNSVLANGMQSLDILESCQRAI